jgi:hypothetical protein
VDLLPLCPKRLAAGRDDAHGRARPQQSFGHRRGGADHMLTRVQHQQQPTPGECLRHALRRNLPGTEFKPKRRGNRGGNQARIDDRREVDQPHTVGKLRQALASECEGQPRLADAASAGQGYEPMRGGQLQKLLHVVISADQLGNRLRQVRRWQRPCGLCSHASGGALVRAS